MSYLEPNCEHPLPWIEFYDCSCEFCTACSSFIKSCSAPNGPDCLAAELWIERDREKGALTDEDVKDD
jgi:hypothetical protein